VGVSTVKDVEDRLAQLASVRPTPNFEPLAASFKRINNILKQAGFAEAHPVVQVEMLEEGPERELYEAYEAREFESLDKVADLRPIVDRYFDKVMVNVADQKVRNNRLGMLSHMLRKFSTIADFSEIVTSGEQK
jgi:glycyl-tRNA synthetase beta chain